MTISAFKYFWYRLRYPHLHDFLDEGLGIMARAERAARFWAPHLRYSKEFQRAACAHLDPSPLISTILGAGRLLDFPEEVFLRPGGTVHLVDADPALRHDWKRCAARGRSLSATVIPHFIEITGRLQSWTTATRRWLSTHPAASVADFIELLDTLPDIVRTPLTLEPTEVVVSLNLLSQIPIYWRERIVRLVRSQASHLLLDNQTLVEPLEGSIGALAQLLQQEHLDDLERLGQRLIIIISDAEFYYYQKDRSCWQVEPALTSIAWPSGYLSDSWLWHIAPQGIEEPDYGAIHKVQAVAIAGDRGFTSLKRANS